MSISEFGPDTRVWLFVFESSLIGEQLAKVRQIVEEHLRGWKSHGKTVQGGYEILFERFVIIAGVVNQDAPSGCSIDSLFRVVRSASEGVGIRLLGPSYVSFRSEGGVVSVTREEFRELARRGVITHETPVFDTAVTTVSAFSHWERSLRNSWHRDLIESTNLGSVERELS